MINCLVVDDEPLAIELLSDYIAKTPSLELVASFSNPIKALQFLAEAQVDLIFLDVQMPELSGIQVMEILNQRYEVILTTAYQQYAIDGFTHDVADYLLKPISFERFLIAVGKVKTRRGSNSPEVEPEAATKDYIFVKSEYRVQKIDLKDILYFEGLGDYVAIHTSKGKILTLENIKYFEQLLPGSAFMRVHKSYIIAFAGIEYIERNRIIIQEQRIPVSETYKKKFWQRVKMGKN